MSRGRQRGSRNRGYFHRPDRGWFAKNKLGQFVALETESGDRIRDPNTPKGDLKDAYERFLLKQKTAPARSKSGVSVVEVCELYLKHLKQAVAEGTRAEISHKKRSETLFDFCTGFPGTFWNKQEKVESEHRIHRGYGKMLVEDLKPLHITEWIGAHVPDDKRKPKRKGWTMKGSGTRIQAVRRAFMYAVEQKLIEKSPIEGIIAPRSDARVTYLDETQEAALLKRCPPALAIIVRALIRVGARPSELAKLTKDHVVDHGDRMEFTFKANESKNGKPRTIYVTEPWIIEHVRQARGPYVFLNKYGKPWRVKAMSLGFLRALKKAKAEDVKFQPCTVLYSTRHSYAQRCLTGFWKGQHIGIETLARLMGNSPATCRRHYLNWCDNYKEPLWAAC